MTCQETGVRKHTSHCWAMLGPPVFLFIDFQIGMNIQTYQPMGTSRTCLGKIHIGNLPGSPGTLLGDPVTSGEPSVFCDVFFVSGIYVS